MAHHRRYRRRVSPTIHIFVTVFHDIAFGVAMVVVSTCDGDGPNQKPLKCEKAFKSCGCCDTPKSAEPLFYGVGQSDSDGNLTFKSTGVEQLSGSFGGHATIHPVSD